MQQRHRTIHKTYIILLIILLGAFTLRIWQIDSQSLSGDEAFTATQWGRASLQVLFGEIAQKDPQPPVSLLTYHGWIQTAGDSEFAIRFISACFSLITVAATFLLVRSFASTKSAILAALICGIAPFQIWYAQDARAYAEWMAFSVVTCALFVRALPRNKPGPWILYILFQAISLQTFYLELFAVAASNLYALIYTAKHRKLNIRWPLSQLIALLTLMPWLLYSRPQDSAYQPTASAPNVPATLTEMLFSNSQTGLLAMAINPLNITLLQLITVLSVTMALIAVVVSKMPLAKYQVILHAMIPLILLTILAVVTQKGFFRTRYIASASAPLIGLIAAAGYTNHNRLASGIRPLLIILLIVPVSAMSYLGYRYDAVFAKAPPWREISAILNDGATPTDIIVQNYPDPALPYYYPGPTRTVILPDRENPPHEETIIGLSNLPQTSDHIWFIRVDTPYWDRDQVVATWLDANTAYLTDTWVGGMRIYQYAGWQVPRNLAPGNNQVAFDLATLNGYRLTYVPPHSAIPSHLTVEVFWEPHKQTSRELRIFAHLIADSSDGSIRLIAQDDHPPQLGRLATTTWPITGEIIRDVYQIPIPSDIQNGNYALTVGLYDPATLERHPIPQSLVDIEPDAITLTTITIPLPK